MRLTLKLTIALTCAILAVLVVNAVVRVRREVELFEVDSRNDNRILGRAVANAAARIWQRVGEKEALDLVEDANEHASEVRIRWVWLDAAAEDPFAPSLPVDVLAQVELGRSIVRKWAPAGKARALYTYVPARIPGPRRGGIELRESLNAEHAYEREAIRQAAITTSVLVLVSAGIMLGLGSVLVGRPVRRLVEQARRIGSGDLASPLHLRQHDEIGQLAEELNGMSAQLDAASKRVERETSARLAAIDQLRHAERLATVGKLASGIAHEVGTPLNVITGHAELITEEYPSDSPAHEHALIVGQQAHRVATIVRQLLDFARPRQLQPLDQPIAPIITNIASLLGAFAQKHGVAIEVGALAEDAHGPVDAGQLHQVLSNLITNAVHATASGGVVTIGVETCGTASPPADVVRRAGAYVRLFVKDTGSGIAVDLLPQIFEPFFTTKDTGQGTGLGLSVAYGIVKEAGGWIAVDSAPGQGACFSVYLPAGDA